jgi:hypothetical protein
MYVVSGKAPIGNSSDPWPLSKVLETLDNPSATGLAVVLGDRSGGLAAREFKSRRAYQKWASDKPELASTLPTIVTSASAFVLCRMLDGAERCLLLPPSPHPHGPIHDWLIEPGYTPPICTPADLHQRRPKRIKHPEHPKCIDLAISDAAIQECIEQGDSYGEDCIFPRGAPKRCTNTEWHVNAKDACVSKRLRMIIEIAESDAYRTGIGTNTAVDLVARVFRAESAAHGGQPFAFSCRALGQACNMGTMTAQRLVKQLVDAGLVVIVSPGKKWRNVDGKIVRSGVSTVWHWSGPPLSLDCRCISVVFCYDQILREIRACNPAEDRADDPQAN